MTDVALTDGLADVIALLHHDARGTVVLVPFNEETDAGRIALAASSYAMAAGHQLLGNKGGPIAALRLWPWRPETFKRSAEASPSRRLRADLVRAAATLIRSIDALDRAELENSPAVDTGA